MICARASSFTSRWKSPLTVAAVPTGMKIGVRTVPWSVVNSPARARDAGSLCCRVNVILILSGKNRENNSEI